MPDTGVDVVICGAGPVGAACALFLRERGMAASRIALIDARSAAVAAADDRMIAISEGSATLLSRLGAWGTDRSGRTAEATPIHTIHVSHRGHFGRTLIDRDDYGVTALGHVVRHGALTSAMATALQRAGLTVRRPLRATGVVVDGDRLRVTTEDGDLATRHVVHAEGGLFDHQQRRAIHRDYGQTAITAFVTLVDAASASASTAFERFTEDGPIALLPAAGSHDGRPARGFSLVWCGKPADAERRSALDDAAFLAALHAAFGDRLGRFASVGPRRSYALGLNAVDTTARALSSHGAEFAIGNAAQALHPVAGQGLNLGLRDAHDLATLLADRRTGADAARAVASYIAGRRRDRAVTVGLTDLMPRVFASRLAPVAIGRGLALALLDVSPTLRGVFARQMMNGRR